MKTLIVVALSLTFTCAAATPLTDLGEDVVMVPRSEVARVNAVIHEMNEANDLMLKELVDLQRERAFLKAKLGCV